MINNYHVLGSVKARSVREMSLSREKMKCEKSHEMRLPEVDIQVQVVLHYLHYQYHHCDFLIWKPPH